ncbi:MAG TPA: patatin-like phospholipase family protein [Longimicrobiales bacterium]|nr:patatin-like phospholipase family protein [Longimicrobiales bacterium]
MSAQFRNLVFEGGGVKGIAYVGVMRALREQGALDHIVRCGGTSAGAINALMFALGYDDDEQLEAMQAVDFRKFLDNDFGLLRDGWRLLKEFGWNRGEFFSGWIGELIAHKLGRADATFAELTQATGRDLYVIGANLSTRFCEVFSHERHAELPLATAVRASMSLPLLFAAVRLGARRDVYVDGGVILNYPVKLFDRLRYIAPDERSYAARATEYYDANNRNFLAARPESSPYVYNRQTLGLRLDTREQIGLYRYDEPLTGKAIDSVGDYAKALTRTLLNVQENQHLHSDDWHRTVYIDTRDIGTTDFDLSEVQKEMLIREGQLGVAEYFSWFENPTESPWNRVPAVPEERAPLGRPVMPVL